MSCEEWKNGDRVVLSYLDGDQHATVVDGVRCEHRHQNSRHFHLDSGTWDRLNGPRRVRRLLVIDPEDEAMVYRIAKGFGANYYATKEILRELANPLPPKPDQPRSFGSVVEQDCESWFRVRDHQPGTSDDGVSWQKKGASVARRKWSDFNHTVVVVREGV